MRRVTEIGKLFREARGGLTLRQIEQQYGVNRERWRSYEVGVSEEPPEDLMKIAATLPAAPSYEEFVRALLQDKRQRLLPAGA